ncbi:MAG: hypothetical protein NTY66_01580, partial [Candidatus Vogelbacteria bacterium]|nr:hypothetical protein [Candidatus Vogelbacteria bacterium]
QRLEYCRRSFEVNGLPKMAIYRCNFGAGTGDCLTGSACQPITSTDIDVIEMKMTESACNPIYCPINPALRNRAVVIMVRAEVTVKGETSQLDFQTTVAQSQSQ